MRSFYKRWSVITNISVKRNSCRLTVLLEPKLTSVLQAWKNDLSIGWNVDLTCKVGYTWSPHSIVPFKTCVQLYHDLTLSHSETHSDTFAADDLWKRCDKRRNCSWWAISPLATMFSTLFNDYTLICGDISHFCQYVFKVVSCIIVVCGKGLIPLLLKLTLTHRS